jgi:peptidylprolyl isomerase
VSGGFGQAPTITFPSSSPPTTLVSRVLGRGDGPAVGKGDLIAVNYTGQIWRGKVFDSTFVAKFKHQTPFATLIGVGKVVKGWDDALPGVRVGSRVLLVLPPKWGYGGGGAPRAGIGGGATIIFVIDVLGTWGRDATAGTGARPITDHHDGVTVTGNLGHQPLVHIASSAPQPTKQVEVLLERGEGPPVTGGLVIFEETSANWVGTVFVSSWQQSAPLAANLAGGPATDDPLFDVPVGSRLLFEEPPSAQTGPYVSVIDIVADLTGR